MRRRLVNGSMMAGGFRSTRRITDWGAAGRQRVFVVAVEPDMSAPVLHGEDMFERMRVLLMESPDT